MIKDHVTNRDLSQRESVTLTFQAYIG